MPLDYVSPSTPKSQRRWPWRMAAAVIVAIVVLVALPSISFKHAEIRIDAVTGSMTWQTSGMFGLGRSTRVDVSPIEMRLKSIGVTWTPSWKFLHDTRYTLFSRSYEHGSTPPIYELRTVLKEFAAASTDAELCEFVRVMQTGTEAEQKAAVDAAVEKSLHYMSTVSRGG